MTRLSQLGGIGLGDEVGEEAVRARRSEGGLLPLPRNNAGVCT
jgi:hypothetical protein